MSLDEIRRNNKKRVTEAALSCFVERGIFNTKISTVAKTAGLTERSVYRYFESKADLVLEAALLFWDSNVKRAEAVYSSSGVTALDGAHQVKEVLLAYSRLYFTDNKKLIFIHEAEIYLFHEKGGEYKNKSPLEPYKSSNAPLSKAIRRGIEDGTVRRDADLESLYHSAYDSLLGLMQKMALANQYAPISSEQAERRLNDFCDMLAASFAN